MGLGGSRAGARPPAPEGIALRRPGSAVVVSRHRRRRLPRHWRFCHAGSGSVDVACPAVPAGITEHRRSSFPRRRPVLLLRADLLLLVTVVPPARHSTVPSIQQTDHRLSICEVCRFNYLFARLVVASSVWQLLLSRRGDQKRKRREAASQEPSGLLYLLLLVLFRLLLGTGGGEEEEEEETAAATTSTTGGFINQPSQRKQRGRSERSFEEEAAEGM